MLTLEEFTALDNDAKLAALADGSFVPAPLDREAQPVQHRPARELHPLTASTARSEYLPATLAALVLLGHEPVDALLPGVYRGDQQIDEARKTIMAEAARLCEFLTTQPLWDRVGVNLSILKQAERALVEQIRAAQPFRHINDADFKLDRSASTINVRMAATILRNEFGQLWQVSSLVPGVGDEGGIPAALTRYSVKPSPLSAAVRGANAAELASLDKGCRLQDLPVFLLGGSAYRLRQREAQTAEARYKPSADAFEAERAADHRLIREAATHLAERLHECPGFEDLEASERVEQNARDATRKEHEGIVNQARRLDGIPGGVRLMVAPVTPADRLGMAVDVRQLRLIFGWAATQEGFAPPALAPLRPDQAGAMPEYLREIIDAAVAGKRAQERARKVA